MSTVCALWLLMSTCCVICSPTTVSFNFALSSRISSISATSRLFSLRRSCQSPDLISLLTTFSLLPTQTPLLTCFPSRFMRYTYRDGTCPNSATAVPPGLPHPLLPPSDRSSSSLSAFLNFDFDQLLVLDFTFVSIVGVLPVSLGVVPLFGAAWGFGVALLHGVDEAVGASGGLDVLRALVDRHRVVFEASPSCASPGAGVVASVVTDAHFSHFAPSFAASFFTLHQPS